MGEGSWGGKSGMEKLMGQQEAEGTVTIKSGRDRVAELKRLHAEESEAATQIQAILRGRRSRERARMRLQEDAELEELAAQKARAAQKIQAIERGISGRRR